jgi:tRNA pseudouridine32 synthase/23S rRNA pseudouridine746 synthase
MTESPTRITLQLTVKEPRQTAVELLATASGLSRQRIKDAMNKGAVWLTAKGKTLRLRRASKIPEPGTSLELHYDTQVLARSPEPAQLLADQRRYSVWFKPHGQLSQGSQWGDHCSLLRWAELNLQPKRECFLVHRLDGDASGIMLIAHDKQAAAKLSQLFQTRAIEKHYQAWVEGPPDFGQEEFTLNTPLDGKTATTHVRIIGTDSQNGRSLLDIRIDTGRKHQIRRHLSDLGHPITGDRLYGTKSPQPLQLLAWRLAFKDPFTNQQMDFELPEERRF